MTKSETLVTTGTLKSLLGVMVVLVGVQYLITGPRNGDRMDGLVVITLLIIIYSPVMMMSSFGSFIKLYRGRVAIGLPFNNFMQISWRIMALGISGCSAGIFLFLGIKLLISGALWGTIFIVAFGLMAVLIVILAKSAFRALLDPLNLPGDWDFRKARNIFYASNIILILGFILTT